MTSSPQSFSQYIGIPWKAGAQGPDAFDCMAFFKHLQREQFGLDVPAILAPDYSDQHAIADLFSAHPERQKWTRIPQPKHGCAVIIHRPLHIGTWISVDGGGVLHCVAGIGVIFTHDAAWQVSGFGRKEYFEHKA